VEIKACRKLFHETWSLPHPSVLISMAGSAQGLELPPALEQDMSAGLVEAVRSTSAWVTTGGTDTGLFRWVGRCLKNESAVVIGWLPWSKAKGSHSFSDHDGMISTYQSRRSEKPGECDTKSVTLEPNHSHFVLVQDKGGLGAVDAFGAENPLRALLEEDLALDNDGDDEHIAVPKIVLCVGGTYGTLQCVLDAVANDRPVVVLPESGGAASWIYDWCCRTDQPNNGYMQKEVLAPTHLLPLPTHACVCSRRSMGPHRGPTRRRGETQARKSPRRLRRREMRRTPRR
jgi:hypothetical protein